MLISQPLEHNTQLCMFLIVSTLVLGLPNWAMKKPELILKFKYISIQSGTFDCGLFTIVFANALVLGEKPQEVFFDHGHTSGKEMKSTLKKSLSIESAEFS